MGRRQEKQKDQDERPRVGTHNNGQQRSTVSLELRPHVPHENDRPRQSGLAHHKHKDHETRVKRKNQQGTTTKVPLSVSVRKYYGEP